MAWLSKKLDDVKSTAKSAVKDQIRNATGAGRGTDSAAAVEVLAVQPSGVWSREVVGESNYTPALRTAVGKGGGEQHMWLTLEREPANRYDPKAIRVHLRGATLGYVPRNEVDELQGLLQAAERQNKVVMVWSRVWFSGGAGTEGYGSVSYDLGEVSHIWPVTSSPDPSTSAIWPQGRRLKVSLSDTHKEAVRSALSRAYVIGRCVGHVRLDVPDAAGGSKLIVSFEDVPIGTLSPAASAKMGEVVRAAQSAGRSTYAIGEFVGNALVAEVKILVKPPEELTNEEIHELVAPVTPLSWAPPANPE